MRSEKYKKAEQAYVEYFQEYMKEHVDDIVKDNEQNYEFPTKEQLLSEKFAENLFHDYAYIEAIIQNLVKGRGYE